MSKSLGTLTLDLVARTGGFVKGMNKAERESKKWRRQVQRDLRKLGTQFVRFAKISAAAGVAAAGAFTLMAKQGLEYVDAQAKMARQTGSTIDGLRGLQIAANDAGINTNTLNGAVDRLNVRLGEARRGSGQAYEALERLGLSADALARMDADQRLAAIADRVRELGLDSADTADLLRNLGIRNREMVNLIMQGGDGIRAARQEVDDYGLSLSQVDARAVERANDAMSRIPRILEPIKNQIAINLAEPLTDVAELFNDAAKESGGFADIVMNTMESAALAVAGLIDQLEGVRKIFLQVREIDLNLQAALEMGQNALTPGTQATPAMDALNDVRQSLARIEAGETVASDIRDYFAGLGEGGFRAASERRARLQEGVDAGLGGAVVNDAIASAVDVAAALKNVTEAANDSADAEEDATDATRETAKAVRDFGASSDRASRALSGIANWGQGAMGARTGEQANGLRSVRQNIEDGRDLSAFWLEPNPTARPTWSTDYLTNGMDKVQGTATSAAKQSSGSAANRGSVKIQVVGDNGNTEGTVEGEDRFIRQLTNVLSGVAAGA